MKTFIMFACFVVSSMALPQSPPATFIPAKTNEEALQRSIDAENELNEAFTHPPGGLDGEVAAQNHAEGIILGTRQP